MNEAVRKLKFEAMGQLVPKKEKYNGADVEGDEERTKDFLNKLEEASKQQAQETSLRDGTSKEKISTDKTLG